MKLRLKKDSSRSYVLFLVLSLMLILFFPSALNAQTQDAKSIFLKNFPNETILIIKSADLNNDKKKETFIITKKGEFYLVNSKGYVVYIQGDIEAESDFGPAKIQFIKASGSEQFVAISYDYPPSSTFMDVYQLVNGTLKNKLSIKSDLQIVIKSDGTILNHWKKYNLDSGWEEKIASYKWSISKQKYVASGQLASSAKTELGDDYFTPELINSASYGFLRGVGTVSLGMTKQQVDQFLGVGKKPVYDEGTVQYTYSAAKVMYDASSPFVQEKERVVISISIDAQTVNMPAINASQVNKKLKGALINAGEGYYYVRAGNNILYFYFASGKLEFVQLYGYV